MLKKLFSVEMRLHDMLYVSYLIPVQRLLARIPQNLQLAEVQKGKTFLSLVIFRGKTSGAATVPTPPIPFDQVNIRTYVVDPLTGQPAVYFIHCGISGSLITFLYRILSGMPVEHTPFAIHTCKDMEGRYDAYEVSGIWHGQFSIKAEQTAEKITTLEPFPSREEAMSYLVDPLAGFYSDTKILRRLEVFHEPLEPRLCSTSEVRFPYLSSLGLVEEEEIARPHNVLLVPYTPFLIYLPARKAA
ncbi:MAG: DUF2071 domain-containing protein [Syntrophorhabdaceae bacterium]|nr:DUF2071 domain-containing protein [Syntrophorhabdaceae bacterium]